MYIVCMKRITKDVALYPLRALRTGLVTLWRAFDGMSIQTALKLFLVGLLVLLYLFWRSYADAGNYTFLPKGAAVLRCDTKSGNASVLFTNGEVPLGES